VWLMCSKRKDKEGLLLKTIAKRKLNFYDQNVFFGAI